ncbi:hypothetical protein [Helicobacter marmotae]|uniref:Poly E-rich protein n=1 Tax=Helicobacter marmotae TaxID=152490 RepID=A0A3D8I8Q2_9HELI|nr:hypothetical protein [Helicobacter marmotae]RDU61154.1 hypothetical protein CQA63_01220 [Helicobacter marmotae]
MKFLLINTNQIVQKLVEITAKKAGVELIKVTDLAQAGDLSQYDYVIIDDDCLLSNKKSSLEALKDKRKCLIYNKTAKRIEGFDEYVQKPFLPTSILDVFTKGLNYNPQGIINNDDIALDLEENLDDMLLDDSKDILSLDEEISPKQESTIEPQISTPPETSQVISNDEGEGKEDNMNETAQTLEDMSLENEDVGDMGLNLSLDDIDLSELEEPKIQDEPQSEPNEGTKEDLPNDEGEIHLDDLALGEETASETLGQENELEELEEENIDIQSQQPEIEESAASESIEENLNDILENESTKEEKDLEEISKETQNNDIALLDDNIDSELSQLDNIEKSQNTTDELEGLDNLDDDFSLDDLDDIPELEHLETEDEPQSEPNEGTKEDLPNDEGEIHLDDLDPILDETLESLDNKAEQNLDEATIQEAQKIDEETASETLGQENELEELEEENIDIQSQQPEIEESAVSEDLASIEDSTSSSQDTPLELPTDGLLENDLLDDIEPISLDIGTKPVLDKDQVNEVSLALNALDVSKKEDFASLKEPDIAHALGEELELSQLEESPTPPQEQNPQPKQIEQNEQNTSEEFVKNMITNSIQSSISSLHSNNFKSMLDGLEVTINISFKDKSK